MRKLGLIGRWLPVACMAACGSGKDVSLARIDGIPFTAGEWASHISLLPPERREALASNPESRRALFLSVLEQKLFALETERKGRKRDASLLRRLHWRVKKLETEYYYEVHLNGRLGYAEDRLRVFFEEESAAFRDGLGRAQDFASVQGEVADSLAARESGRRSSDGVIGLPAARLPDCGDPRALRKCLADFRREISERAFQDLFKKYRIHLPKAGERADSSLVRAYYERNRDRYLTDKGYEVDHLEFTSEEDARKAARTLKSREDLAALARESSWNQWTRPLGGKIGVIKEGHCLPYGIGLLPGIFPQLDTLAAGAFTTPMASLTTGRWHLFRLERRIAPSLKPFDRVRAVVEEDLLESRWAGRPDRRPILGLPDGDTLRQGDLAALRAELRVAEGDSEGPTPGQAIELLILWSLGSLECRALSLDREPALEAKVLKGTLEFWASIHRDEEAERNFGFDPRVLEDGFRDCRHLIGVDSSETDYRPHSRDVAACLVLSPEDITLEHRLFRERYPADTGTAAYQAAKPLIFRSLQATAHARVQARLLAALMDKYRVEILDPSLGDPPAMDAETGMAEARRLHAVGKDEQAIPLLRNLRDSLSPRERSQDSIGLMLAELLSSQGNHVEALAEYRRLAYFRPDGPGAVIARFKEAYALMAHLRNPAAAESALERFLAEHPDSDLARDAAWLLRSVKRHHEGITEVGNPGFLQEES